MWRKILVSALVLLYSLSVVGLPLHYHYCKGELKHITLFVKLECHGDESTEEVHTCCGVLKSECSTGHVLNKCCDDNTQWLHETVPAVCLSKWQQSDDLPLVAISQACRSTEGIATDKGTFIGTDPDPPLAVPIYLSNCSLILYH